MTSENVGQLAIAEHATNETHVINWGRVQVVDSHTRCNQWRILEAWHIRSQRNNLNRDERRPTFIHVHSLIFNSSFLICHSCWLTAHFDSGPSPLCNCPLPLFITSTPTFLSYPISVYFLPLPSPHHNKCLPCMNIDHHQWWGPLDWGRNVWLSKNYSCPFPAPLVWCKNLNYVKI